MKQFTLTICALMIAGSAAFAQLTFDPSVDANFEPTTVVLPPSPLKYQILFVGQQDMVQHTAVYGNPAGEAPAKQWHDFIGVTPDENNPNEFWISVNHEMRETNDFIGDGGGMTAFKVRRDPNTDTLVVIDQTLNDGRQGKFFNVDFVNTTGETGMNCAGIVGPDGRIWTAEEWSVDDNEEAAFLRDTSDWTFSGTDFPSFNGKTVQRYQTLNWMVEIDPKQAVAIRKQYNWGRQFFEGGAISNDNTTVYLGEDATPGYFTKYVADTPGDFVNGTTYVYKHDAPEKWIEIDNSDADKMLNFGAEAIAVGATCFNRLEWVAVDRSTGRVYMTETGRDGLGSSSGWRNAIAAGSVPAQHHVERSASMNTTPTGDDYFDRYGRILCYDPVTEEVTVFLEGGPSFDEADVPLANYPDKHLSNPDGLNFMETGGRTYMLINEDLNGTSHGRMPAGISNRTCEAFIVDIENGPVTVDDLIRISVVPLGAEVTGVVMSPDGKTMLLNSQHPSANNPAPYNNSLTYAITGWNNLVVSTLEPNFTQEDKFQVWPNPVSRELNFNKVTDAAIFDMNGKLMQVVRNTKTANVSDLTPGMYIVKDVEGEAVKLIVE